MNTNINKGRIIFYEEGRRGGVWRFYGGGTPFFSEPKKGGGHVFFPEFNIKYFFKKGMQYKKSECKLYYWATVCFTFKYGLEKILFNT